MKTLIILAGLGQLILALASLSLPGILRWREDTAKLEPLTREVFWTYAAYIWATNVAMGLLSVLGPGWFLDRTPLARAVAGYVTLYWGARLAIQFGWFGKNAPPGALYRLGEAALVALFLALTLTYGAAAVL
jgi:hypothetical protein